MPKQTKQKLSTTIANPIRTGVQGGIALGLVEFLDSFEIPMDYSDRQYAASVFVLTLIIGAIQNAWENRTGKGFLRAVPPTEVPIIDDGGAGAGPTPA